MTFSKVLLLKRHNTVRETENHSVNLVMLINDFVVYFHIVYIHTKKKKYLYVDMYRWIVYIHTVSQSVSEQLNLLNNFHGT